MENIKAIILAAGEGTRMKSKKPKVLHELFHKPMVQYVINAAKGCGAEEICMVIGHEAQLVKDTLQSQPVTFALQPKQLGTGHAVMQAIDFIEEDKDILILYGDTPLITSETLEKLVSFHRAEKNGVSIISAIVDNPAGYGHIIRDKNGKFLKNIEHKDATIQEQSIREINTGIYCYQGKILKEALKKLNNNNTQGEYYLPDTLEIILNSGSRVNAMQTTDITEFFGVNSRAQLAQVQTIMKHRINTFHMENGVTLIDPDNTYIDDNVKIGMDTVIHPGTILTGNTVIGEDCVIGPYCKLDNVVIGTHTTIQYTTAIDSEIGNDTTIGPYAYIRPNCHIGSHIRIGDFVEMKNSTIGDFTKVPHLTYIGDSDVGEHINIGCGTVTVNYDGKKKFRTIIEDNVFIGCNTNLVAPVTVKKGAYIAAGSTITKDVPESVLSVARARQQNIEGWTKK